MFRNLLLFLVVVVSSSCAKRGSITGGSKDTLGPVLKISFPKNYSTNFKGSEIKLTFDEYIKLKDLNENGRKAIALLRTFARHIYI